MHPEVKQDKPGRCSICGMRLEETSDESLRASSTNETKVSSSNKIQETSKHSLPLSVDKGKESIHHNNDKSLGKNTWGSYLPLFTIIGLILLTILTISFKDLQTGTFSLEKTISYFMIGFFLTFAGFKLIDLKGFAQGYSTYDLLAQRWINYGYIYPFIELFFGLSMILSPQSSQLLIAEVLVMGFSGIGVARKLLKGEQFQCVCLGTFLKIPLTKVTLIEDFGMAGLALLMLLL